MNNAERGGAEVRRRTLARFPSLQDLCLAVLVPGIVARGDRYAMKELGPDIAALVFENLKRTHKLSGNAMKLFMHSGMTRVDLGGYSNTTAEYMESIAGCSLSLTSLILSGCHLLVDRGFERLRGLQRLTLLDLSGCKLQDKSLVHLKNLRSLAVLRLGRTKVTTSGVNTALRWFPNLVELDLASLSLTDGCVGALRTLTTLERLNLASNNFRVLPLNPLKELRSLSLHNCNGLAPESLYWIAGCTRLASLDLTHTSNLTGKTLFQLRHLTQLEHLALPPSARIEPESFAFLRSLHLLRALEAPRYQLCDLSFASEMHALAAVNVANCPVSDLRPLAGKAELTQLNLQSCTALGDHSWATLQEIPYLRTLQLSRTRLNHGTIRSLRSTYASPTGTTYWALRPATDRGITRFPGVPL